MKYKVCFHISYHQPYSIDRRDNSLILPAKWHGKMHYCGNTLEDAVSKVRSYVASLELNGRGTCTSMWIMRGTEKDTGKNIKWGAYHKPKELKSRWRDTLKGVLLLQRRYANR